MVDFNNINIGYICQISLYKYLLTSVILYKYLGKIKMTQVHQWSRLVLQSYLIWHAKWVYSGTLDGQQHHVQVDGGRSLWKNLFPALQSQHRSMWKSRHSPLPMHRGIFLDHSYKWLWPLQQQSIAIHQSHSGSIYDFPQHLQGNLSFVATYCIVKKFQVNWAALIYHAMIQYLQDLGTDLYFLHHISNLLWEKGLNMDLKPTTQACIIQIHIVSMFLRQLFQVVWWELNGVHNLSQWGPHRISQLKYNVLRVQTTVNQYMDQVTVEESRFMEINTNMQHIMEKITK